MPDFAISRSVRIDADPSRILPLIVDFREWPGWSPWEGLDPALERRYSGAGSGVGARYAWSGNSKAGQGSMEITGASENRVELDLSFVKPFKATNRVRIDLTRAEDTTEVTWTMSGRQGLFGAAFFRLLSMEKSLGEDFLRGLTELKRQVEQG